VPEKNISNREIVAVIATAIHMMLRILYAVFVRWRNVAIALIERSKRVIAWFRKLRDSGTQTEHPIL